jgi:hypothetical protein
MPLKGEYTWSEKKDQVKLVIPLKGVSASKVDIFGAWVCVNVCVLNVADG